MTFDSILEMLNEDSRDEYSLEGFGDIMKSIGGGIKWVGGKLVELVKKFFSWIREIFGKMIKSLRDAVVGIKEKIKKRSSNKTKDEKKDEPDNSTTANVDGNKQKEVPAENKNVDYEKIIVNYAKERIELIQSIRVLSFPRLIMVQANRIIKSNGIRSAKESCENTMHIIRNTLERIESLRSQLPSDISSLSEKYLSIIDKADLKMIEAVEYRAKDIQVVYLPMLKEAEVILTKFASELEPIINAMDANNEKNIESVVDKEFYAKYQWLITMADADKEEGFNKSVKNDPKVYRAHALKLIKDIQEYTVMVNEYYMLLVRFCKLSA